MTIMKSNVNNQKRKNLPGILQTKRFDLFEQPDKIGVLEDEVSTAPRQVLEVKFW